MWEGVKWGFSCNSCNSRPTGRCVHTLRPFTPTIHSHHPGVVTPCTVWGRIPPVGWVRSHFPTIHSRGIHERVGRLFLRVVLRYGTEGGRAYVIR